MCCSSTLKAENPAVYYDITCLIVSIFTFTHTHGKILTRSDSFYISFKNQLLLYFFFLISFQINSDRFNAMWPKLCVLARSKPSDKFTLVKGMMESTVKPAGEIVAVTGSGANDGPVLRMADVGFTMVISKTY